MGPPEDLLVVRHMQLSLAIERVGTNHASSYS